MVRTPEERFRKISDFPFKARYIEKNSLRIHYIDEGKGSGELILCLHGEPTWSYLYRKMVPILASKHRVLAFDFIGFGRSDKFTTLEEYTYQMHFDTLLEFIQALKLKNITLVVQDWGGLIGLPVAANFPRLFSRLVIMNTGLPTGKTVNEAFLSWRDFVEKTPDLPIGQVITMGMASKENISSDTVEAYEAPFPDISFKYGTRAWPLLVPISPDDPIAAIMLKTREQLKKWDKPVLVMFSDKDPITRGADKFFRNLIPTAAKQPVIVVSDAGHFLQEEKGEEIANHIMQFIDRTPLFP